MKINYLKEDKDEIQLETDNITIVEILRVYLNKDDSVNFAAWNREHPSKNPILTIQTKGKTAKKALQDAIASIGKDADAIVNSVKKAK